MCAIIYNSGRRIQATQADFDGTPAVSGGWKELARTTLGSAGDTISVSSLPDKRYYMVLYWDDNNSTTAPIIRFNNDSGSNYSARHSTNGGSDGTSTNATSATLGIGTAEKKWGFIYIVNKSDKEKLAINSNMRLSGAGAGNAPHRYESVFKWANTSSALNRIDMINDSAGNFGVGSEVVVLGWDPDDTHTDNFWEQLASVTLSGASSSLDSGTITAKKYLCYQVFIKKNSASNNYAEHSINGITTGNTWARRINSNGGTDGTNTSQNTMNTTDTGAGGYFLNGFVINNSGQEKLFIEHVIQNTSSGAGNAPDRKEIVMKSTTSAQITQLTVTGATNGYDSGSFIKVWGSN